jgi:hypothetical protein
VSDAGKVPADLDEVGRKHGYRDSRHWFLPGFARIAATLALGAVFIPLLSRVRPFRAAAFYALGATIATIVTLLALAMGSLSSIVIASALLIAVGIFMATLGGTASARWRVAWRVARADVGLGRLDERTVRLTRYN